jgi:aminocarboxymuconate-semialdehyde decarboxylase
MLFRCAPLRAPADTASRPAANAANQRVARSPKGKSLVVDLHCHLESPRAAKLMSDPKYRPFALGNELTREVNRKQMADIRPQMESVERRLADMDKMGVDVQAVSSAPYFYFYNAEPELGRQSAQLVNDDIAALCARHPDRFVGLGTLPLQNTEMAIAELERCVTELGLRGIEIGTNVEGEELSSPRLAPLWARLEELDVVVFMHPSGLTHPQRLLDHYLANIVGNPLESMLAVSHLIFDGVLERHGGLKLVIAHGGGFLPAYAGRQDHAWRAREDVRIGVPKPPGDYLKRLYFDTMVFEADQLAFLIKKYGADHIVLGTDYPYDMGDYAPLDLVGKVEGLSAADKAAVIGGTAARLLKL